MDETTPTTEPTLEQPPVVVVTVNADGTTTIEGYRPSGVTEIDVPEQPVFSVIIND